ncbi:MAG TPA: four-helix bundle copper-binding protein [Polyangiaceae bacterium]|nr:four-helix bundle copper-binding protein [Polyangiaceae bacterium]
MPDLEGVIAGSSTLGDVDAGSLVACIETCQRCVASCTACADECLSQPDIALFRRCIRLCLDCADVCSTLARLLSRRGQPELSSLRAVLEAGTTLCAATAIEAQKHADTEPLCKLTAEICLASARACDAALTMLCAVPSA